MNEATEVCPLCGKGSLSSESYSDEFEYEGKSLKVHCLEKSRCDACGEELVLTPQIRANQVRIADAKRSSAGLLYGNEIRAIREALGLSQPEAAEVFGGGANAFSKYERGETIQSAPMDRLLRIASRHPWIVAELRNNIDQELARIVTNELYELSVATVQVSIDAPTDSYRSARIRGRLVSVSRSSYKRAA